MSTPLKSFIVGSKIHGDFFISQAPRGKILTTNKPGFTLILFYSHVCKYCRELLPVFRQQIPSTLKGCQYADINVSDQSAIIHLSKQTIMPIQEVPFLVLYVNGKPFRRFSGNFGAREIIEFVMGSCQEIKAHSQNTGDGNEIERKKIHPATEGHPICGDDLAIYLQENGKRSNFVTPYTMVNESQNPNV